MLPEPVRRKGSVRQRTSPTSAATSAWLARLRHRGSSTAWPRRARRSRRERAAASTKRRASAGDLLQRLMPADALRIRGRHNAVNALAALALRTRDRLPLAPMLYGLREYRGEPHRVEPIGIDRRHRLLRRQQGHERRRHGRRAARPGRATQVVRDPRRRRQGPGLRAAGRAGRALRARRGADRPRRAAHPRRARAKPASRCSIARTLEEAVQLAAATRARRRRRADVAGLRELRHVPQLRAPRRGVPRRGAASPPTRRQLASAGLAAQRVQRSAAHPVRRPTASGDRGAPASRPTRADAHATSTRRWSGSRSRCSRSAS